MLGVLCPLRTRVAAMFACRTSSNANLGFTTHRPHLLSTLNSPTRTQRLDDLSERVLALSPKEISLLGKLVLDILGKEVFPGEYDRVAVPSLSSDAVAESGEVEKSTYDIKLVGFDAGSKLKLIKEVRSAFGLGLKEAKDMVESCPKVLLRDVAKDRADELRSSLESLGAQIEVS